MRGVHAIACAVLAGVLALACQRAERPNLVLVTFDAVRADELGAPTRGESATPSLDALAARGVVFEQAFASAPLTLPSHTTILTGLDPYRHGVRDDGRFAAAAELETVAEALAARDYDTAAFVASEALAAPFGLDQGFGVYDDAIPRGRNPFGGVAERTPADTADAAAKWLASRDEGGARPFLIWVQLGDGEDRRRLDANGESEDPLEDLRRIDAAAGRVLEAAEQASSGRPLLAVALGSHGRGRGEHGELSHGLLAYDTTLRIPLIASGPGLPAGARSTALVRTVDVAPTLRLAAGAGPGDGDGAPLAQRLAPGDEGEVLGVFESLAPLYAFGWGRIGGVRTARWKYTAEPQPAELYDVEVDPGETRNVADQHPEVVARLAEHYEALRAAERDPALTPLPAELRRVLEELAGGAAPEASAEPPDPRRFVKTLSLVDRSRGLAKVGRVPASIQALEALATSPVLHTAALQSLAVVQRAAGRLDEATASFARWALASDSAEARIGLADALLARNRADLALASVQGLEDPRRRPTLVRGAALFRLGRTDEALAEAESILAQNPDHDGALALRARVRAQRDGGVAEIARLEERLRAPGGEALSETRLVLAELLLAEGRDTDALDLLRIQRDAPAEHRAAVAEIALKHERVGAALALYEGALARQPANRRYRFALANLYDEAGRLREALALYDAMIAVDPDDASLYVDRGAIRHRAGLLEQEERDYRRALELDPEIPELHFNLALIDRAAGREDEAEQRLLRAVALRSDFPDAHLMLAKIYGERGDARASRHAELAVGAGEEAPLKIVGEGPRSGQPAAHVGAPRR